MRKSERLTTLGTLAAEIAHEIRNPLMVVRLLFDSLNLAEESDQSKHKDLSIIREKLNHLEQVAGRILDFGKSRESFRRDYSLNEILNDASLLIRLKLEQSQVALSMNEISNQILVFVDKGQIQQALLNLVLNAVGAMPNGGELEIYSSINDSNRVEILVKDTGSGIPIELQPQIFDSFLTGRSDGTGLGLTISKRILRSHDGDLELLDSGENGTTFKISLPISHT